MDCVINKNPVFPSTPSIADKLLVSNPPPPPPPPPPNLVEYIVGSDNVPLESAIPSSGLHGAHRHVAASLSLLFDVDTTCINSHITSYRSQKLLASSFATWK